MGSEEANVQRILNIVGIASIVALAATPAAAGHGGFLGGLFGGGRGAPGPEAAVGLPFLVAAGAYMLMRRRAAKSDAQ